MKYCKIYIDVLSNERAEVYGSNITSYRIGKALQALVPKYILDVEMKHLSYRITKGINDDWDRIIEEVKNSFFVATLDEYHCYFEITMAKPLD